MSDAYLPGDTRQRIQDLIKDRKITQAELAENVGLSNSALSRYLQGNTKNLGDGFIIRIAKYFDVSTDSYLGKRIFSRSLLLGQAKLHPGSLRRTLLLPSPRPEMRCVSIR